MTQEDIDLLETEPNTVEKCEIVNAWFMISVIR
jgi:hypothetical protein